ncbi:MAG: hypothetical protein EPN88_13735 [Bacteroidetes bacterium]|nr:MAG: hypothetical protein EPN88_13735 [Bacteroidota bacterium]
MIDTSKYIKVINPSDLDDIINSKVISFDIESCNADIYDKSNRILSISFSCIEGESKVVIIRDNNIELLSKVKNILENVATTKVVAARPFDESIVKEKLGIEVKGNIIDVLTMAHVIDENYTINLENVANKYTSLKNIKEVAEGKRDSLKDAEDGLLVRYNGVDSDATLRCFNALKNRYDKRLKRYYQYFVQPVQNMLSEISTNGCYINKEVLKSNELELLILQDKYEKETLSFIPEEIKEKYKSNLKLTRSIILSEYLFIHEKGLKLKPQMFTGKTKKPSLDEKHLKCFSKVPFIKSLLKYRKVGKLLKPYIFRLWESIKKDGCIYPNILLICTVTGRTVILNPSIQTYPKRGEFAKYIRQAIETTEGWLFGTRDLAQSELRIMGWLANDPTILKALKDKIDLHIKTAESLGITRQEAKAINFGFIYAQSAKGFKIYAKNEYDIDFSMEESENYRDTFFNTYPRLLPYHSKLISETRKNGYSESPLGRRRHLPDIKLGLDGRRLGKEEFMKRISAERQAINSPIQSFSSDLGLIAMMLFNKEIKERGLSEHIKILWFIHDDIMFRAKKEYIIEAHEILRDCLSTKAPEYIKKYFDITVGYPIESEGKVGKNWSEMKSISI